MASRRHVRSIGDEQFGFVGVLGIGNRLASSVVNRTSAVERHEVFAVVLHSACVDIEERLEHVGLFVNNFAFAANDRSDFAVVGDIGYAVISRGILSESPRAGADINNRISPLAAKLSRRIRIVVGTPEVFADLDAEFLFFSR